MKIRKGFISNSSSTSFICDVCAETVGGWDMGLDDADMFQCENGHTFCRDHTVGGREAVEEKMDEDEMFDYYEVAAKYCPCCTFEVAAETDIVNYFLKATGQDRESVAKVLREKFPTFADFQAYLKK